MINLEDVGINRTDDVVHIANLSPSYVFEFESLSNAVKTIITSGHRRIPVVSKSNVLVGIITYMDILNGLLRGLSANTHITSFMTREVIFCELNENMNSVIQKMKISRRGGMPIVKEMKLIGVISERDIVRTLSKKYFNIMVGEIMSHKPFFVPSTISVKSCMKTMVNTHYRRLPIVDNKEIAGIITGLDILRFVNNINYNPIQMDENITDIMSTPVKYVMEYDDIADAIKIILENNIGGLPVINEENNLKGIITERDLIELL